MNQSHEAQIHYLVSFIGGFLGIFPIVNASHFLGSAQTSNLIDILLGFIYGNGRSVEIYCNGDKSFSLKARFFGLTLLCFHLGLTVGWIFWHFLGNAGFLFVIVPAAAVVCGILKK